MMMKSAGYGLDLELTKNNSYPVLLGKLWSVFMSISEKKNIVFGYIFFFPKSLHMMTSSNENIFALLAHYVGNHTHYDVIVMIC